MEKISFYDFYRFIKSKHLNFNELKENFEKTFSIELPKIKCHEMFYHYVIVNHIK